MGWEPLTDEQIKEVSNILQKKASIEAKLAQLNTLRSTKQIEWNTIEQKLKTLLNNLETELRNLRPYIED